MTIDLPTARRRLLNSTQIAAALLAGWLAAFSSPVFAAILVLIAVGLIALSMVRTPRPPWVCSCLVLLILSVAIWDNPTTRTTALVMIPTAVLILIFALPTRHSPVWVGSCLALVLIAWIRAMHDAAGFVDLSPLTTLWTPLLMTATMGCLCLQLTRAYNAQNSILGQNRSEARAFEKIVESRDGGVWEMDANGNLQRFPDVLADQLGLQYRSWRFMSLQGALAGKARPDDVDSLTRNMTREAAFRNLQLQWRDSGQLHAVSISGLPLPSGGWRGTVHDISQAVRNESDLEKRARRDALTGVLNRREFVSRFAQAFDRARTAQSPIGLVIIDLCSFKTVNSLGGLESGDEMLILVADQLRECFGDDTSGRLGGDEFGVMAEGSAAYLLDEQIDQFRRCVRRVSLLRRGKVLRVEVRIGGVCGVPESRSQPTDWIAVANARIEADNGEKLRGTGPATRIADDM